MRLPALLSPELEIPISPYTEERFITTDDGDSITKLGADGNLLAKKVYSHPLLGLNNDKEYITITEMTTTLKGNIVLDNDMLSQIVESYNFATGEAHKSGSKFIDGKYEEYDCTSKYEPVLPITITKYGFSNMPEQFDEDTLISTTCPSWLKDTREMKILETFSNNTLKTDDGVTSHFSKYFYLKTN